MANTPLSSSISLLKDEQSHSARPLGILDSIFDSALQTMRQTVGWCLGIKTEQVPSNGAMSRFVSLLKHGESDFPAPLLATEDSLFGFVLQSDRKSVQQFVDATLGAPPSGITYRVLGDHVVLLFQHCGRFTSPDDIGWAEDHETAILIPLIEKKPGTLLPEKVVFWIPYLMIDVALGMVTGRDVWGYNKTFGSTSMPDGPNDAAEFKCNTLIFRKFDRNRKAEFADLITVARTGKLGALESAWREAAQFFSILQQELGTFHVTWEDSEEIFDLAGALLRGYLPLINLKQMRDSEQSQFACYQALVEAKLEITQFHRGGPLPGKYEVTFCDCESHAIVQDFGFKQNRNGKVPVALAFWAELDFNAPAGTTIWQAP